MEVCFPWSANDNGNLRFLFQQTCPSTGTINLFWRSLGPGVHWIRIQNLTGSGSAFSHEAGFVCFDTLFTQITLKVVSHRRHWRGGGWRCPQDHRQEEGPGQAATRGVRFLRQVSATIPSIDSSVVCRVNSSHHLLLIQSFWAGFYILIRKPLYPYIAKKNLFLPPSFDTPELSLTQKFCPFYAPCPCNWPL